MNEKEKRLIDKEVLDIILFHLKILKMEVSKENVKLATVMFIEGTKYIREKINKYEI